MKDGQKFQGTVEVFTACCPCFDETVELVQRIACPRCRVEIRHMRDPGSAGQATIHSGVNRSATSAVAALRRFRVVWPYTSHTASYTSEFSRRSQAMDRIEVPSSRSLTSPWGMTSRERTSGPSKRTVCKRPETRGAPPGPERRRTLPLVRPWYETTPFSYHSNRCQIRGFGLNIDQT